MLIGIDGNEANVSERVGVHQYAYHILWGLYKLSKNKEVKHNFVVFLQKRPNNDLPKQTKFWKYRVIPGKKLWILTKLTPHLIKDDTIDLFFTPSHYLPPLPTRLPKICTIHDLGYLRFSEQFKKYDFWQLKLWTAISISISKRIISVSKFTKQDIVRHYGVDPNKIFVTHHGYDVERFSNKISTNVVRQVREKFSIPEDKNYILFLSTLKPSKNIEGLIDAFDRVKNKHPDLVLVIAGKKGWMYGAIFEKVRSLGLEKAIIFTDYVSEEDKPALLFGAKVFVSPSFWEGFGIHVLEAMVCGTPVVVSKVASLPEIVGNAGIYVNPEKIKSIADGLEKVLNMDPTRYNKLVESGLKQSRIFSWEKAARQTIEVFKKAVQGKYAQS